MLSSIGVISPREGQAVETATRPAALSPFDPLTASRKDQAALAAVARFFIDHDQPSADGLMADLPSSGFTLVSPSGEKVVLPSILANLLREATELLAHDRLVSLVALQKELTTQQAADLLQVSRPHLISLLERGELPYSRPGAHRRIKYGDLLAYKERRDRAEEVAIDELAQLSQDLGLYE